MHFTIWYVCDRLWHRSWEEITKAPLGGQRCEGILKMFCKRHFFRPAAHFNDGVFKKRIHWHKY